MHTGTEVAYLEVSTQPPSLCTSGILLKHGLQWN